MIAFAFGPFLPALAADAEIEVVGLAQPGPSEVQIEDLARPADGVEDVLATVPGVRIRRLGGLGSFAGISLRGTGFRQTLIRLDGVPLNADGVAAVDLSRFPLAGLQTIRVTSGRPAATVGAAPVGGVVDLVTTTRPSLSRVEFAGGSFRSIRGSAALARSSSRGVEGLLAFDGLATGGGFAYLDDGGTRFVTDDDRLRTRQNNDRRQVAGLARLRLGDQNRWTLLGTAVGRSEGLPGPIGLPLDGVRLTNWRGLAAAEVRRSTPTSDRRLQAYLIARRERLSDPRGALGRINDVQRDRFDVVGLELSGQRSGFRGSVTARHETFGRDGATVTRRFGGAMAVDRPLVAGPLTVTPGLDLRGLTSRERTVVVALPGATGVFFGDRAVSAWVSATAGFRPPDLTELYGDRGTLSGNPELRPERARKAEIGLRASGGGEWTFGIDGALSAAWLRDAIGWLQNTQRTLVAVNFGRTRTLGAEVGGRLQLRDRMGIHASLTLLDAVQTIDDPTRRGRPVPFVVPIHSWSRAFVRPLRPLAFTFDVDHTAAVPVDPQGVTTQPRRTLLSTGLAVTARRWTISVRVDNLLDQRTGPVPRDPLGSDDTRIPAPITDFVGYPLPGRTAWVALRWSADERSPP